MNKQIILASVSPRRAQLVKLLDLKFKIAGSGYKEIVDNRLSHEQLVKFLALGKAKAAAKKYPRDIIIAADTMVSFEGQIIGKPKSLKEAKKMLKNFSGKIQYLITGVVIMDAARNKIIQKSVKSKIYFKKLSHQDINNYVKIGKPLDKAGGYNLQGPGLNLIQKIQGDFTNNLGLPMNIVFNAL